MTPRHRTRALLAALVVLGAIAVPAAGAAPAAPPGAPVVTATPDTGLVDGHVIAVHGDGFDEQRDGFALFMECAAGATRAGCRIADQDGQPDSGPGGTLDATYEVDAAFRAENGTVVDCRIAPGTCVMHAFTEAGTDVVDAPLTFDPDAPLEPPPTLTVTPDTDLVDGQLVHAEVAGFRANGYVRFLICDGPTPFDRCYEGYDLNDEIVADADGHTEGDIRLKAVVRPGVNNGLTEGRPAPFDCRVVSCHLVVTEEVKGNSDASTPLAFDPDAPLAPTATLEAHPTTGLVDGQVVTVDVTDLFPGERIEIAECSPTAQVNERCHPDEFRHRADADGTIHGTLPVYTGFSHAFLEDQAVDCYATPCELWLWRETDADGPLVTVALSFVGGPAAPTPVDPVAVTPQFTG